MSIYKGIFEIQNWNYVDLGGAENKENPLFKKLIICISILFLKALCVFLHDRVLSFTLFYVLWAAYTCSQNPRTMVEGVGIGEGSSAVGAHVFKHVMPHKGTRTGSQGCRAGFSRDTSRGAHPVKGRMGYGHPVVVQEIFCWRWCMSQPTQVQTTEYSPGLVQAQVKQLVATWVCFRQVSDWPWLLLCSSHTLVSSVRGIELGLLAVNVLSTSLIP